MRDQAKRAVKRGPKVLFFDLETAGVQGLRADRGFVVCFGWKWLGDKDAKCITILDYPGKNCHDDKKLLAAAIDIVEEADSLVAHFGSKFDRPYLETRLLMAGLPPIPQTRLVDTCLVSRFKLKLSSNRLGNLAMALGCENKKMEKRGGWPDWWMGALRGDRKSILDMATYCKADVVCLEDVYLKMRHIVPDQYLYNHSIGEQIRTCVACGSHSLNSKGLYRAEKGVYQKFQCRGCGKYGRGLRRLAKVEL